LNEGENQASDVCFDGRGTRQEKFYWRPVAPTDLRNQPFGGNAEGLSHFYATKKPTGFSTRGFA
jgi:hypothetical protein